MGLSLSLSAQITNGLFQDVGKERLKLSGCVYGDGFRYFPAVPFVTQISGWVGARDHFNEAIEPWFVERRLTIKFNHPGDKERDNRFALNKGEWASFIVSGPLVNMIHPWESKLKPNPEFLIQ